MRNIILASGSPRRRELMAQAGFEFEVIPSTLEEKITKKKPWEAVEELARQKADEIYEKASKTETFILVIGADTMVSIGGVILGKPKSKAEAHDMLSLLQGKTHEVFTGVSLVWDEYEAQGLKRKRETSFFVRTEVTFYPMSEKEIEKYLAEGESMDKAGAYGIQGKGAVYIEKIDGDYHNVVGLPIAKLYQKIMEIEEKDGMEDQL